MLKRILILVMFVVLTGSVGGMFACSGGGGGGTDNPLNFEEGVTPENIAGTYDLTLAVTNNTCPDEVISNLDDSLDITIVQDGASGTMQSGDDYDLMECEVSGSSFRVQDTESFSPEAGCDVTMNGTIVGHVNGEAIDGNISIVYNAVGNCDSCQASVSFSGQKNQEPIPSTTQEVKGLKTGQKKVLFYEIKD